MSEPLPRAVVRSRRVVIGLLVLSMLIAAGALVALVVILLMLGAILGFIATAWRQDRLAAWLFMPYAAWVAFASVLNASSWRVR